DTGHREIFDVQVPMMTIPVAPGRNLAVLVEAAVRSYMLKSSGIDPAQTFIDRQARQLQNLPPWYDTPKNPPGTSAGPSAGGPGHPGMPAEAAGAPIRAPVASTRRAFWISCPCPTRTRFHDRYP